MYSFRLILSLLIIISFKIMIVNLQKKIKAHGSENTDDLGEIYKIIGWQDKIASLALDSMIKIWDHDLNLISQHWLVEYYMFSLAAEKDKLYIGNGNGEIKVLDENFKHVKTVKICEDIVSDIKIYGNSLVTVSYDGTLAVVDLENFQVRKIKIEGILFNIIKHQGYFYIGGTKSYKINQEMTNIEELQRTNEFFVFDNNIYGISDRRGMFDLCRQISTFSPCDSISTIGHNILGAFDDGITLFSLNQGQISWKSQRVPQFKPGYPLRAILPISQKEFVVGGDSGVIYKFVLEP